MLLHVSFAVFVYGEGFRFSDIMKERSIRKYQVSLSRLFINRDILQHRKSMFEHIKIVVIGALVKSLHLLEFGNYHAEHIDIFPDDANGRLAADHIGEFLIDPFGGYLTEQILTKYHRLGRLFVDLKIHDRSKPQGSHDPQCILGESSYRITYCTYDTVLDIFDASDKIPDPAVTIKIESIHRKVAPFNIFFNILREFDIGRMTGIFVIAVRSESSYLYRLTMG